MTSNPMHSPPVTAPRREWRWRSLALIFIVWLILQMGGLFAPGLLDDVDSVYIQIAREMLGRHDFVTPTIDGIRFFDKPPLMYWMAAGSMHLFGQHDWAARLPLALGVLGLFVAVYALGIRFFRDVSLSDAPDRGGLYAALAIATSVGPYLYTRFYIPDILIALWLTLSVHFFLLALQRIEANRSALLPSIGFAAVLALDLLTKGLIGIVFPLAIAFLYLAFTRRWAALRKLHIPAAAAVFLALAAPWHVLAALRNPAIPMPVGVGLPARAGWTWFYLYNEHVARFLGRRIPHDYGQVPIPLFWLLLFLWLLPWAAFLPAATRNAVRQLRQRAAPLPLRFDSDISAGQYTGAELLADGKRKEAALSLLLWAGVVLGFFTLSSRQEYYHLPALPALALLVGGLLATADTHRLPVQDAAGPLRQSLRGSLYLLVPFGTLLFLICGYLAVTSPAPPVGVELNTLLDTNPDLYNLSLGHVFDLTGKAMGYFRAPLSVVALCMLLLGPGSHLLRQKGRTLAANLLVAAAMTGVLLAAHEGLARFYPILGSKDLAAAIKTDDGGASTAPVLIDGELTAGSSLIFYMNNPVLLVNGRVNGPWFGSFWPDARPIFLTEADMYQQWHSRSSLYLLTYHPEKRIPELCRFGPVVLLANSGGKTVLRNNLVNNAQPNRTPATSACR